MAYEETPKRVPQQGFYYHYKHDPAGPVNNYAYEVVGIGHHTEDDCRPIDAHLVIYRPLYEAFVYTHGKMYDVRPLTMFMEEVEKGTVCIPRFTRITDPATIVALERIKETMYPGETRG